MKFKILISVLLVLLVKSALVLDLQQREAWREDIVQLQVLIKEQHINPFAHLSEQAFDKQVNGLVESLSKLEEAEVETRIMQLMRSIGDAHTSYNIMSGPHRHFPFRFKYFAKELRVVDAIEAYRHLLGAKLVGLTTYPDLPITTRWQDYKKGRDDVLLGLLRYIQGKDAKNAIGNIKG